MGKLLKLINTMSVNKKKLTPRGREIYNEGVRDALKEVWLHDGIISDANDRKYMVNKIQEKVSYKFPTPKKLHLK